MKQNMNSLLPFFQGLAFVPQGPFLVAKLPATDGIPVGKHGMEEVKPGQSTKSHAHGFASFYKSDGLNVSCNGKVFRLPKKAVTLVLPGVPHSWIPKGARAGKVGSVDARHRKQVVV
jgi:hypothetical protein